MKNLNIAHFGIATALALAFVISSAGCGSGPQRYYYTLSYPEIEEDNGQIPPALHKGRLRVKRFTIGEAYNRPQLVYRQSPYEFQYYGYRYWAAKPQKMLRDIFHEHLKKIGLFEGVEQDYGDTKFDYELSGEIDAIEEFDAGNDWYAHLAMNIELTRLSDKKVIWRYSFDRRRKVEKKSPVFVIKALSEILKAEMNVIAAGIDAAVAAEEGGTTTLTCTPPVDEELPVVESFPGDSEKTLRIERPSISEDPALTE